MEHIDINNIEKYSQFEWIKSDRVGETEIFNDLTTEGNMKWINFLSGRRVNAELLNEYMSFIGVLPPEVVENIQKSNIEQEENKKILEEQTRLSELKKIEDEKILKEQNKLKEENLFYFDIIEKAKKDTILQINIPINFNFISKEKLEVLTEIYGDKLSECLSDYIYSKLSKEDIINSIKNSITND